MKRTIIFAGIVLTVTILGSTGTAWAEKSAWTGCVTHKGKIKHLAQGDAPAKPCKARTKHPERAERLIHLYDQAALQNPDATLDYGAMCEAFHALNLGNDELEKLGCPSTPTLTRPGTLSTRVKGSHLVDNDFNVCGILKVQVSESDPKSYNWAVPGGFVAATTKFAFDGGRDECIQRCAVDDKCIAAWWDFFSGDGDFGTCRLFHYSDHLQSEWTQLCGLAQGFATGPLKFGCADRLNSVFVTWVVRVPDGQSLENCPGAAPVT